MTNENYEIKGIEAAARLLKAKKRQELLNIARKGYRKADFVFLVISILVIFPLMWLTRAQITTSHTALLLLFTTVIALNRAAVERRLNAMVQLIEQSS
jgi:polyferredoxin